MIFNINNAYELKNRIGAIAKEKKIYIYGAGTYGKMCGKFLLQNGISFRGYIDKSEKLHRQLIEKHYVYSIQDIATDIFVIIAIMPPVIDKICESVYEDLLEVGLCDEQIYQTYLEKQFFSIIQIETKKPYAEFKKWNNLKEIYSGKRAFLIGNGPSLKIQDLNLLENELTFGCNGILELAMKKDFHITGYYFQDPLFIKENIKSVGDLDNILSNCEYAFTTITSFIYDEYKNISNKLYFTYHNYKAEDTYFSDDVQLGICCGDTSLFSLLQIMVYMGIKEIILLGVDFSFKRETDQEGNIIVNNNIANHPQWMKQYDNGLYNVDGILKSWICAKKYADQHGIKIYNATRGGKLEVFERVDFDTLF